jgi:hypothetical protein
LIPLLLLLPAMFVGALGCDTGFRGPACNIGLFTVVSNADPGIALEVMIVSSFIVD